MSRRVLRPEILERANRKTKNHGVRTKLAIPCAKWAHHNRLANRDRLSGGRCRSVFRCAHGVAALEPLQLAGRPLGRPAAAELGLCPDLSCVGSWGNSPGPGDR